MHRYPGTRPFQQSDAHLFHGRKQEIKELSHLIIVEKLVILFAKSGIGKTSLLNAGVVPYLRAESKPYFPIFIRFNDIQQTPDQQTRYFLQDYLPDKNNYPTLWETCKYLRSPDAKTHETVPLLIFDQFEELFTLYTPDKTQEFVTQFADLVSGRIPDAVQQQIRNDIQQNPDLSDTDIAWRETPPYVKIIIAIRSDYLSYLDQLSTPIPAILRNRFQLYPLAADQAQAAIVQPAMAEGTFESPIFSYSAATVQQLQTALVNQQNEVESFQLQLICQFIEDKIIAAQKEGKTITVVEPDLYGGEAGLQSILNDFYTTILDGLDAEMRPRVQRLVEQELIKNERRISLAQDLITIDLQIPIQLLKQLTEVRLLRKEPRLGSYYYELSHDTLIKPILITYKERKIVEDQQREIAARQESERRQAELNQQLKTETKRRRFLTDLAMVALAAMLVAAIAATYAQYQKRKAQISQQKAIQTASRNLAIQSDNQLTDNFTQAFRLAEYAYQYDSAHAISQTSVLKAYYNQGHSTPKGYRFAPFYRKLEGGKIVAHSENGNYLCLQKNDKQTQIVYYSDQQEILWSKKMDKIPLDFEQQTVYDPQPFLVAALSPNGEKAAILFTPETVTVCNKKGDQLLQLPPQKSAILTLQWFADNQQLIVDAQNDSLKCYNEKGELTHNFGKVSLLAAATNGNYISTFGNHKTYLTNLETNKTMTLDRFMNKGVFSSNGQFFVGINQNDDEHFYAYLYNTNTQKRIATLAGAHTEILDQVTFSPDNKYIALASFDKTISLWDNKGERISKLEGHTGNITQLVFLPNSDGLVSAAMDNTIRLWQLSYELDIQATLVLKAHQYPPEQLFFNATGTQLISQSEDAQLQWQLVDARTIQQKLPTTIASIAISTENKMAVACWDKKIYFFDANGKAQPTQILCNSIPTNLLWLPNSNNLVVADETNSLFIYNTTNGSMKRQLTPDIPTNNATVSIQLAVMSQANWVSSIGENITIWDNEGNAIEAYHHKNPIHVLASSNNKQQPITYIDSLGIRYQLDKSLNIISHDTLSIKDVKNIQYSPRGNQLVVGNNNFLLLLDDTNNQQKRLSCLGTSQIVWIADNVFMVVLKDGTIKLFDATGEPLVNSFKVVQEANDLTTCAISPDGHYAAIGNDNGSLTYFLVHIPAISKRIKQQKIYQLLPQEKQHYGIVD